ncbi:hypothetical protein CF326_g8969, partial [Tilletia indica]
MPARLSSDRVPSRVCNRVVRCHCFRRCTAGTGPPSFVVARTRDSHLAADKADLQHARNHGMPPHPLLVQAIRNNEVSITAEALASDSSSSSSSSASSEGGLPNIHAAPQDRFTDSSEGRLSPDRMDEDDALPFFPPDDDEINFDVSFASGSAPQAQPSTSGSSAPGDQDKQLHSGRASSSADSTRNSGDSGREDSGGSEGSGDDMDGLLADQLDHFFLEENDSDDEAASRRSLSPDLHQRREGDPAAAEQPLEDPDTRSRHGQHHFDALAGDYQPGPRPQRPPDPAHSPLTFAENLTPSQTSTLDHLRTSIRTNATVRQYKDFARGREKDREDIKISGKDLATSLMKQVTGLHEERWDMCPKSCMAFVGPNSDLQHCTAIRKGRLCGAARFDARGKAIKQFVTIPFLPRVKAKFAAGKGSIYLHDRSEWASRSWDRPDHKFQDWSDGAIHRHL